MIYMSVVTFCLHVFYLFLHFVFEFKSLGVKWVGSGPGRLRLVQNDRTGCPEVLEWVLTKNSSKKTVEIQDFP